LVEVRETARQVNSRQQTADSHHPGCLLFLSFRLTERSTNHTKQHEKSFCFVLIRVFSGSSKNLDRSVDHEIVRGREEGHAPALRLVGGLFKNMVAVSTSGGMPLFPTSNYSTINL
jgi:hypothetical protein